MSVTESAPGLIDVYFVLLPDSLVLDWAGPAEALRITNQALMALGQPPRFQLHFVSPTPTSATSVGVMLSGLKPLPLLDETLPCWVVLVGQPGSAISVDADSTRAVLHWLRGLRLATGQLELVTVCAGSVFAAHADLLAGRRATTHHHHLDELQRIEPRCDVISNRVFVVDGPVFTSAGVTTGIDLFLHRITAICGPALAAQVAQTMVVALRRGPHDPEFSLFLAWRSHLHPGLHRVQDAVSQMAHASPRHLHRLFALHAGIPPLDYLRCIRLAVAQAALESGWNVTQAASMAGFSSSTQLHRAWHQFEMASTPSTIALLSNK